MTALTGQDKKNAAELGRRVGVYASFVAQVTDPMVVAAEMLTEAEKLETWLIEEVIGTEAVTNPAPGQ